jgi:tRNA(Ile2) C34 agmatinyltransferase TiaS
MSMGYGTGGAKGTTCPDCGAEMHNAGQSGYICPTSRCPRSWYGTLSEARWDEKHLTPEERERAQRMRAIWRGRGRV